MDSVIGLLRDHITWDTPSKTDVYPLLERNDVREQIIDAFVERAASVDRVAGIEATGLVFGSMLAERLDKGFVAVRRQHKWPFHEDDLLTASCTDYSDDVKGFAVRDDQIRDEEDILLVDDWIETGSQFRCVSDLLERAGGDVVQGLVVVQETSLDYPVTSLATVE